MPTLAIAQTTLTAGSRGIVRAPVTRDLTGDVDILAHVVAGTHDGPTLLLLSMLHGNEWFSAVVLRELLAQLDPATLRGNVIAIPVANAAAMATATRCIQDNADEPDANRTFGGPYQWLSNQITRALSDEFMSKSDAIIDFRVGPSVGGYFEPTVDLDRQFTEVMKGEVLARVHHAMTFELLEEVRSPGRGIIFYACRSQMVRPGGWGFGVASLEDARTEWVG